MRGARLEFSGVVRRYGGVTRLRVDDLQLAPGSFNVLLGRSGCGKTSLLELAAGLASADEGRVTVDGQPVDGPVPDSALVFQQHNLFPWMSAAGNVAFALRNAGVDGRAALERATALLGEVGLAEFAHERPSRLSGGMRQRVALARTIALEPRLLLLDEPFSALDAQTRRLMQRTLLEVWRRTGATVLMVTHDLDEAVLLADRIVLMASAPHGHVARLLDLPFDRPRSLDDASVRSLASTLDAFLEHEVLVAEHAT
jgi:NitT/TauT family transport system ATP-binding protein